jgi:hypothetical protein
MKLSIVALAVALSAGAAQAQFTTVVAPPPREEAEAPTEVAARDTGHRTALRDMAAWVDSVAGVPAVAVEPGVVTDSATGTVTEPGQSQAEPVTRFENGSRAPDTATSLPALLIGGVVVTAIGTILLFSTRRRDA